MPGARYTEVTLDEMDKFLRRGFRALRPKQDQSRNEIFYDLKLGRWVGIRIWTSIGVRSETGAGVGSDAIRVQFISLKDEKPLEKGKAPIVKRTQGWKNSLQDRIEDYVEKYEDNDEFWEDWAETRRRKDDPSTKAPSERPPPERPAPPPEKKFDPRQIQEATFAKLRDGTWGIRVPGDVEPGDQVVVTRKDGRKSTHTVESVVFKGQGYTLARIPQSRYASEDEPEDYSYSR